MGNLTKAEIEYVSGIAGYPVTPAEAFEFLEDLREYEYSSRGES
jgi:hypothetical protein